MNWGFIYFKKEMRVVPRARIELALPKKPDFESGASTNSATPAMRKAGGKYKDCQHKVNISVL
jgi:hypothetical protein